MTLATTGSRHSRTRALAASTVLLAAAASAALLLPAVGSADPHPNPAGATRTWVSGVGDDVNPCSRTAPCKTFAGAISKTAEGGEINVLDPGGYGGVTITKAISIRAVGNEGGVLVGGGNGIVVNAGDDDDVVLSGLDFEGIGLGTNGVNFINGASVHISDSSINNFTTAGINFASATPGSTLVVDDVRLTEMFAVAGIGIWVHPSGAGSSATITDTTVSTSTVGLKVESGSTATVNRSAFDGAKSAVWASAATTAAEVNLVDSTITGATQYAVRSQGDTAVLTLDGVHLSGNALGIKTFGTAKAISYGTNVNRDGGAPTSTVALQ